LTKTVNAGTSHTCGVEESGYGYCWGIGSNGRLGTGQTGRVLQPQPILPP
jgi:alpha-tubulin suppressor-like RCC1 family protein